MRVELRALMYLLSQNRPFLLFTIALLFLISCTSAEPPAAPEPQQIADIPTLTVYTPIPTEVVDIPTATHTPIPTQTEIPTEIPATNTLIPTETTVPTSTVINPTATVLLPTETLPPPTPTPWPSATPWPSPTISYPDTTVLCSERIPTADNLLAVVTRIYGLSRAFEPNDLVTLTDYIPAQNILGNNNQIRSWLIQPIQRMIVDSRDQGVQLLVLSGYRGYAAQQLAWNVTARDFPDRVHLLVAQPGHSEHQLGTTIDFGSPDFGREFTKEFANTPEGVWLRENAHHYGFTMSYPENGFYITGFEYEPWHFRYVGVENATKLNEIGMSLTEWQLTYLNQPCVPDTSTWPEELSQPANQ